MPNEIINMSIAALHFLSPRPSQFIKTDSDIHKMDTKGSIEFNLTLEEPSGFNRNNIAKIISYKTTSQLLKLETKFNLDKIRLARFIKNNDKELEDYFKKAVLNILELNPDNIVFSLTSSQSINYRIYKDNFEVHFEVFYTKDDADDKIEAVYSIYRNDTIIKNGYGALIDSINELKSMIVIKKTYQLKPKEAMLLTYGISY